MLFEVSIGAAEEHRRRRLDELDSFHVGWLNISVLPRKREHQLLESFGNVELQ